MGDVTTGSNRSFHSFISQQTLAPGATVDNPSWSPFRHIDIGHEISDSSNSDTAELTFPFVFDELTNIVARAIASATCEVSVEFDIIIIPKNS